MNHPEHRSHDSCPGIPCAWNCLGSNFQISGTLDFVCERDVAPSHGELKDELEDIQIVLANGQLSIVRCILHVICSTSRISCSVRAMPSMDSASMDLLQCCIGFSAFLGIERANTPSQNHCNNVGKVKFSQSVVPFLKQFLELIVRISPAHTRTHLCR